MPATDFEKQANIWLATVRPDGRPHLAPLWFVATGGRWYFCTAPESVKARNLQLNAQVSLALEDGNHPHVVEGEARPVAPSPEVVRLFQAKYDWNILADAQYTQVYEVTVRRERV